MRLSLHGAAVQSGSRARAPPPPRATVRRQYVCTCLPTANPQSVHKPPQGEEEWKRKEKGHYTVYVVPSMYNGCRYRRWNFTLLFRRKLLVMIKDTFSDIPRVLSCLVFLFLVDVNGMLMYYYYSIPLAFCLCQQTQQYCVTPSLLSCMAGQERGNDIGGGVSRGSGPICQALSQSLLRPSEGLKYYIPLLVL